MASSPVDTERFSLFCSCTTSTAGTSLKELPVNVLIHGYQTSGVKDGQRTVFKEHTSLIYRIEEFLTRLRSSNTSGSTAGNFYVYSGGS